MSQNQGLSEDELRDYINSAFSLRLERDVFLKPQREVLIDIYQKFLDDVFPNWRRKLEKLEDTPVWFLVFRYVRLIVRAHNKTYPIQPIDVLTPTRQRIRVILSILIFHREFVQDVRNRCAEDVDELLLEQKDYAVKEQELAKAKERIEQLAIRLSTCTPVDKQKLLIAEKERELEQLKAECDKIGVQAKEVKSKNLANLEVLENKKRENEALELELGKLKTTLETLNDGLNIERKISDTERRITDEEEQLKQIRSKIERAKKIGDEIKRRSNAQRLFEKEGAPIIELIESRCKNFEKVSAARKLAIQKHQDSILEHQKREESMRDKLKALELQVQELKLAAGTREKEAKIGIENEIRESKARQRELVEEGRQLAKKTEEATKARAELKLKTDQTLEHHKKLIEKADRKMEHFMDVYQKSKSQDDPTPIIFERVNKINALLGIVEPEMTMVEVPANRTYIKDAAPNMK